MLVFFAATQDIAVDGWALTLLSEDAKSYASTAQTVGLNTGYFASFTVFLALNSAEFALVYYILPIYSMCANRESTLQQQVGHPAALPRTLPSILGHNLLFCHYLVIVI